MQFVEVNLRIGLLTVVLASAASMASQSALAQYTSIVSFASPLPLLQVSNDSSHLTRQLSVPGDIIWSDVPVRRAITRLAETNSICLFLDRRVDPDRRLNLRFTSEPLQGIIEQTAREVDCQISVLPPIVYLGPPPTAAKLATLYQLQSQRISSLPPRSKTAWLKKSEASWPILTEPRQLLESWYRDARIDLVGLESVPHDLWPAQTLPATDLVIRSLLVLAGFELTIEIDGQGNAQVIPMPTDVHVTREFRLTATQLNQWHTLREQLPLTDFQQQASRLVVKGRVEEVEAVASWLANQRRLPRATRAPSQKRYSLAVQQEPLEGVLTALVRQLDLQLQWDATVPPTVRSQRVSFDVRDADLDELLDAVVQAAGCTQENDGHVVTIRMRK